jgi:hypothetical protein
MGAVLTAPHSLPLFPPESLCAHAQGTRTQGAPQRPGIELPAWLLAGSPIPVPIEPAEPAPPQVEPRLLARGHLAAGSP